MPPHLLCRVHFALTCKALLRQYGQDEAAWLRGLHVSLACSSSRSVAACEQQMQRLLQRLPPGSITSLSLTQLDGFHQELTLIDIASTLRQGLHALDIQLQPNYANMKALLDFPLLRCASLEGTSSMSSTFGLQAPVLQSLTLSRCRFAGQLPLALTRLDLREVHIQADAAPSVFTGGLGAV